MSEPVTNVEIEDVLSSIRRLVSDEARAPQNGDTRPAELTVTDTQQADIAKENDESEAPDTAVPPALVLTEALRVVAPDHGVEPTGQTASEEPGAAEALILDADLESAPSGAHAEAAAQPGVAAEADVAQEPQQGGAPELETEPDTAADETPLEEPSAVDTQSDDAADETAADSAAEAPETAEHDAQSGESAAQGAEQLFDQEPDETSGEPRSIEDKIAALEALINRSGDAEFEPDGAEDGGNAGRSGEALPWEDSRAEREDARVTYPDPESPSEATQFDEGVSAFERARAEAVGAATAELEANASETLIGNDEVTSVLDEEALRDMVAEIVRQELQGPLGERITRNVRKLVRREIYRALAANELD